MKQVIKLHHLTTPQTNKHQNPLQYAAWESHLQHHLEREFTSFILDGIRFGFRIGVPSEADLVSARANLSSVKGHSSIVEAYIEEE